MNLQDAFLNQVRVQKIPVTIYLMGGHQLKGFLKGFDNFIIMLDVAGKYNLVYKHAISTIIPLKPVLMFREDEEEPEIALGVTGAGDERRLREEKNAEEQGKQNEPVT